MGRERSLVRKRTSDYFLVYNRDTDELIGRLINLTTEGAMLISDDPIDVPTISKCKMVLPEEIEGCKEVTFDAKSKWCKRNEDFHWYETGYQFLNVSDVGKQIIILLTRDLMAKGAQGNGRAAISKKQVK